ncbi:MAG: SPOR domain-containing protein [Spirochaetales bacterium]
MDHRKLLIIILSVAVFVALILGLALLAYYPGDEPERRAEMDRDDFDPIEFVRRGEDSERESSDRELSDDDEDDDFVIVYGSRQEDEDEDEDRNEDSGERESGDEESDDDESDDEESDQVQPEDIDGEEAVQPLADPDEREPRVHGGDRADEREAGEDSEAEADEESEAAADAQESETEADAQESETAAEAQESETAAEGQESETAAAAQESGPTREYWIQVLSSSSRDTAEAARERLEGRSLGSVIFPVTVSGQEYYRVRVGPYENPEEAQKFLGWIQDLDGFEESYVSRVTRS